ncbi:hypothetical protein HALA3H3_780048 [Halomonas sp. A3H3]|nr:conserved hypothetical protein [Halomonas sp. 156]CAD5289768.1 conserved hypothetical protein [Halomonas sp. I3]CDG54510.1 hypothetical protein HALA3H3_780048 [Halomonas sp. A3H3]
MANRESRFSKKQPNELGFVRKVGEQRLDKAKINEKAEFTGCK